MRGKGEEERVVPCWLRVDRARGEVRFWVASRDDMDCNVGGVGEGAGMEGDGSL